MRKKPVRALGIVCFSGGIVLLLVGCYMHVTTIADIPAAEMTLRLQWTGWEWGVGGMLLMAVGSILRAK
jgi:hypothetical protein